MTKLDAERVIAALTKRPELLHGIQRVIRKVKVIGPWEKAGPGSFSDYERCLGWGYGVGRLRHVMQTEQWHWEYNTTDDGPKGIRFKRGDVKTIEEARQIVDEGLAKGTWAIVLPPIGPDGLPWW